MLIVYSPADGEVERYDIKTLRTSEASIAQKTLGISWAEIQKGIDTDDPEILRGVAYVLKKRAEPTIRYGDFDPIIGELVTKLDKREVADYVKNAFEIAETDGDVSREAVAAVCQRIVPAADDPEHAERIIAEMAEDPKDEPGAEPAEEGSGPLPQESPSNSTETSTSSEQSGSASSPSSSASPPQ
ncbi:hypothetical protein ACIGMX_16385 [Streptomyces aquilus]|uniref:hypothetical protein n=1 Tax=Streptomyces aquilus TaxID=2548456 RepID=UPI0037D77160